MLARLAPLVLGVKPLLQLVVSLLPSWRCDIQCQSGFKIDASGKDVHMDRSILLDVFNRTPATAPVHSRIRRLLKLVQDVFDLRRGGLFGNVPRDHTRTVAVIGVKIIGDCRD